jgi:uncharacterized protein YkwD
VALLAAGGARAGADPGADPGLDSALIARLNQARAEAGVPPLAPHPALATVARERAAEIGERGAPVEERDARAVWASVQRRLRMLGYEPHLWSESLVGVAGDVEAVVAGWRAGANWGEVLRPEQRHAAVGVGALGDLPLYVLLVAGPRGEAFARETQPLADLERVRQAALAAVNAARLAAGRRALDPDGRLDRAAQAHAEDMLRRSYYDHSSPEGASPLVRVQAAGFPARLVGENLAAGMRSLPEAMAAWLGSSGHRRNLLEARFTHLGMGVAVGRYEDRYQVLWVQEFARP